jgi:hypothetical protein
MGALSTAHGHDLALLAMFSSHSALFPWNVMITSLFRTKSQLNAPFAVLETIHSEKCDS